MIKPIIGRLLLITPRRILALYTKYLFIRSYNCTKQDIKAANNGMLPRGMLAKQCIIIEGQNLVIYKLEGLFGKYLDAIKGTLTDVGLYYSTERVVDA